MHAPLIPHLFRLEFARIVSVLAKFLGGMDHLQEAEDIASETFLAAMETWPYKGVPDNPVAWLHTVARNRALNHLKRRQLFAQKIQPALQRTYEATTPDIDLSDTHIRDSQLQMLFAICNPILPAEAQVSLALRILCGFGIDEIAAALLSNKEAIHKKLVRAKDKLRKEQIAIAFPAETELVPRLDRVLTTLYLLFNEGYYSENGEAVIRESLCTEAMRLVLLLMENPSTNLPQVGALYALMCFQASRFPARVGEQGEMILYHEQDESLWDRALITKGAYFLQRSATGQRLSQYHLEATIAYWYTVKEDTIEKWEAILLAYNRLLQLAYSPIAALNRTYAFAKVHGRQAAIPQAKKLALNNNCYYHTLMGALYEGDNDALAEEHYLHALQLARSPHDKAAVQDRLQRLRRGGK